MVSPISGNNPNPNPNSNADENEYDSDDDIVVDLESANTQGMGKQVGHKNSPEPQSTSKVNEIFSQTVREQSVESPNPESLKSNDIVLVEHAKSSGQGEGLSIQQNVKGSKRANGTGAKSERDKSSDSVKLMLTGRGFKRRVDIEKQDEQNELEKRFFEVENVLELKQEASIDYNFTHHFITYHHEGTKMRYDLSDKKSLFKYFLDSKYFETKGLELGEGDKEHIYHAFDQEDPLKCLERGFDVGDSKKAMNIIEQKYKELNELCDKMQHLMRKQVRPTLSSSSSRWDKRDHQLLATVGKVHTFLHGKNPAEKHRDRLRKEFLKRSEIEFRSHQEISRVSKKARRRIGRAGRVREAMLGGLEDIKKEKEDELETKQKEEAKRDLREEIKGIDQAIKELEEVSMVALEWVLMELSLKHDGRQGTKIIDDGNPKEIMALAKDASSSLQEAFCKENGERPKMLFGITKPHSKSIDYIPSREEGAYMASCVGGLIYHLDPRVEKDCDSLKVTEKHLKDPIRLQHIDYQREEGYGRIRKPSPAARLILHNAINGSSKRDQLSLKGFGKGRFNPKLKKRLLTLIEGACYGVIKDANTPPVWVADNG